MHVEPPARWTRLAIANVEVLGDAVRGAGLRAVQLSRTEVTGTIAFSEADGISYATGSIGARVALTGMLSKDLVTLGVGLTLPAGARQWLNDVRTGDVGVFRPGDDHDAIYVPGSLYVAVTLSADRAEEAAAALDLVLEARGLADSGILRRRLPDAHVDPVRRLFRHIHESPAIDTAAGARARRDVLHLLLRHIARAPRAQVGLRDPRGRARIVARARGFIEESLGGPLSIAAIARGCGTSERTLHRAFESVLDETPYDYVQKLRLHRFRQGILEGAGLDTSLTALAERWGLGEVGRTAGRYRALYGELPSQTRRRATTAASPG